MLAGSAVAYAYTTYPISADSTEEGKKQGNKTRRLRIIMGMVGFFSIIVPLVLLIFDGFSPAVISFFYVICIGAMICNFLAVFEFSEAVSQDLLEHASDDRIQDALKNNWTNTALLSALLFTIVAGYGLPFDSEAFPNNFHGAKVLITETNPIVAYHLGIIYYLMVSVSFADYVVSFLLSTIHLMWTEALSAEDAKQYYADNRSAPAAPMIWLVCGTCWHLLATEILFFYGYFWGCLFLIPVIIVGIYFVGEMRKVSKWSPNREGRTVKAEP
jgi:hypothetical protein